MEVRRVYDESNSPARQPQFMKTFRNKISKTFMYNLGRKLSKDERGASLRYLENKDLIDYKIVVPEIKPLVYEDQSLEYKQKLKSRQKYKLQATLQDHRNLQEFKCNFTPIFKNESGTAMISRYNLESNHIMELSTHSNNQLSSSVMMNSNSLQKLPKTIRLPATDQQFRVNRAYLLSRQKVLTQNQNLIEDADEKNLKKVKENHIEKQEIKNTVQKWLNRRKLKRIKLEQKINMLNSQRDAIIQSQKSLSRSKSKNKKLSRKEKKITRIKKKSNMELMSLIYQEDPLKVSTMNTQSTLEMIKKMRKHYKKHRPKSMNRIRTAQNYKGDFEDICDFSNNLKLSRQAINFNDDVNEKRKDSTLNELSDQ
ncbi:UNKNOWN [Stylonychia lemnae]|uniref:Uncharacterized protein n=1 Tax=Stylonychia lemnae TaxID=5949 RepID=A0A078AG97_STYLE|nr:UNKNOWN [Stylonychia lemnae]|eukprot:CDW81325.1 UNKNOWN [Stylonychia lemnae]